MKRKALKNICSLLVLQIITLICGFIIPKLIIINYGSNTNGLISSISKFLTYITLLEFGIGPVIKSLLYKPIANNTKDEIINILYASTKFFRKISLFFIIYVVLLSIFMPLIINEFDTLYTLSLVIIMSLSIFFEYYFGITYKLFLDADQKTYVVSMIQSISLILNLIVVIFLIKLKCSIQIIKLITALIYIIRPIIYNIYVKLKYKIDFSKADKNYVIRKKFDGIYQHIAYVVHNNNDIVILTLFSSLNNISIYYIYLIVINSIKSILQSITSGIEAILGDMIVKNIDINSKFRKYEIVYYTILTIFFIASYTLISPFVYVYTSKIKDINYVIPLLGYLIVITEFIWAIRLPYSSIVHAKGDFKEVKIPAIIEIIVNILLSILLVFKYNLIGVVIGTLIAMLIRTSHFIYYASKYILKRNIMYSIKNIFFMVLESILVINILNNSLNIEIINYYIWIIEAIKVILISVLIVIPINIFIYKKEVHNGFNFSNN